MYRSLASILLLAWSVAAIAHDQHGMSAAPRATVTEVTTHPLLDYPGKEALTILVEYPPGSIDPVHRHNAHAFIYVIEGSIVMGLNGGKDVTVSAGQSFYEGPDDVHTMGRNASKDKPARFLVVMLKDIGAPVLTPVR